MKRLLFFFFLTSGAFGADYSPWFSPLWEFEGHLSPLYRREKIIQSPRGNFSARSNNYSFHSSLGITPWPYWNAQIELLFTRTHEIPFSYEAFVMNVRYQWLDDIQGDPVAIATGLTLSFPGHRYLNTFGYAYHGEINTEFHLCLGKEWVRQNQWWMRLWTLGGWGIANRGNGWLHFITMLEFQPKKIQWGVFTESLFGLGSNDIIPNTRFKGYASIDHQTIDLGAYIGYQISCLGSFSILGWKNVYAHNFVLNDWAIEITLLVPFSF